MCRRSVSIAKQLSMRSPEFFSVHCLPAMPASRLQLAKRVFVRVLVAVATTYQVRGPPNRDSDDAQLVAFYRRLLLKVHPDKGGRKEDFQGLQSAKEAWEDAKQHAAPRGRPSSSSDQLVVAGQQRGPAARVRGWRSC